MGAWTSAGPAGALGAAQGLPSLDPVAALALQALGGARVADPGPATRSPEEFAANEAHIPAEVEKSVQNVTPMDLGRPRRLLASSPAAPARPSGCLDLQPLARLRRWISPLTEGFLVGLTFL